MIIGELLFLSRFCFIGSGQVHNVQEGSNQRIQPEGWPRKFLLQLLSNLPLLFPNKKLFQSWIKYFILFLKGLIITAFFAVYYLSIVLSLAAVLFLPINRLNSNQKFTYLPGHCVNRIVEQSLLVVPFIWVLMINFNQGEGISKKNKTR